MENVKSLVHEGQLEAPSMHANPTDLRGSLPNV
jgi:hypothetical protein